MKKIVILIGIILVAVLLQQKSKPVSHVITPVTSGSATKPTDLPISNPHNGTYALFVPYWTLDRDITFETPAINSVKLQPNTLAYFGITANESGIDKNESGFLALSQFVEKTNRINAKKILTLRLLNDSVTEKILDSSHLQDTILSETTRLAQTYGFDGIMLDLEVHALATDSMTSKITTFITYASQQIKKNNLSFAISIYGDVFYRVRPYDIAKIDRQVDHVYIMAYDLHKAKGEPGPNFPLSATETHGYDISTMLADFTKYVDSSKITIIFGMYGYDWTVDDKDRPLKPATALTLSQINNRLSTNCIFDRCKALYDKSSTETEITYRDDKQLQHIVWFENERSVSHKIDYFLSKHFDSFAFWAYGYY